MKELQFGKTPFDHMPHEELLELTKKMYDALNSSYSCMRIIKNMGDSEPFWGHGSGGVAIEKCRQIIEPIHEEYSSDDIYRVYYRYAVDLLFAPSNVKMGFNWIVCPECGEMISGRDDVDRIGKTCKDVIKFTKDCDGVLRKLTWKDLGGNMEDRNCENCKNDLCYFKGDPIREPNCERYLGEVGSIEEHGEIFKEVWDSILKKDD